MIDPLTSTAPPLALTRPTPPTGVTPVAPASAVAKAGPEAATPAAAPPPTPATPKPLALEVKKANDGVFVYTLSNPETHAVVVVIPHKQVDGSQEGQAVDTRV